MLSIIYFKKPILFVYFLLGLLILAPFCCLGLKKWDDFPAFMIAFMMFGIGYYIVFNTYVLYHYLTKNTQKISVLNVDITSMRKPFKYLFVVNLGFLLWIFLKLTWLSLDPDLSHHDLHYKVFIYSAIYCMGSMFPIGLIVHYIHTKIMASVIETVKEPKAIIDLCYTDLRRILVDKLK